MPTLMTTETFGKLLEIWRALDARPPTLGQTGRLAGIFVPWAGARLIGEGGIYYIGIATAGDYRGDADPPTFDAQRDVVESLCTDNCRDLAASPFWQFLDGLTWALLDGPFHETTNRWGWSNLLKIGWSDANPNAELRAAQQTTCINALREEFDKLHDSLIVIVSNDTFGVLDSPYLFPQIVPLWNTNYHEQTGLYWFKDQRLGNLYVHGYHPRATLGPREPRWGSALGRTIQLARALM